MNITLTKEESEVLVTILSMVGGHPAWSARKVADDIIEKMANNGVFL
jgi:alkylhydroperoxidase/carboxymuconolactone decarboxylase family protein YurZ